MGVITYPRTDNSDDRLYVETENGLLIQIDNGKGYLYLPGWKIYQVTYIKRDESERMKLRDSFNSNARKQFLKEQAKSSEVLQALQEANVPEVEILKLQKGFVPKGYEVHHKLPLDDGGDNNHNNLILIPKSPHHTAIHRIHKETKILKVAGHSIDTVLAIPKNENLRFDAVESKVEPIIDPDE
jgi:hypothetical protein